MKKALVLILVVSILALLPQAVFAHPGNTDKKGGHTCRTNCAKWGLKQGQYHYHKRK